VSKDFAIKLMLDSGAFSAWKLNKEICVKRYRKFLLRNREHLWCAVNLDIIPGRPGTRTSKQVEEAAAASWANYQYLTEAGLNVMPVYHFGERLDWLKRMVDSGAPYVGLGGVATAPDRVRRPWLDEMFNFFCGTKGYPTVKIHGMGITSPKLVERYPWYSTDSISWVGLGGMGMCTIPVPDASGRFDYFRNLKVGFSKGSVKGLTNTQSLRGDHYKSLGRGTRAFVDRWLEEEGFDAEELCENRNTRLRVNARYFKRMAEAHPMKPHLRRAGLFSEPVKQCDAGKPPFKYRIVFSGADKDPDAVMLTKERCRYRLISYFLFMDGANPVDLPRYVRTGCVREQEGEKIRLRV
jgi:hypothetical protein